MLSSITNLEEYAAQIEQVKVPLSRIDNALTRKAQVQWDVARLDLLDKELSGNKLFKLLPFLLNAKQRGLTRLVSFGGMYSNHLHALAAAGRRFGFYTVGIVRGYAGQKETPTLNDLRQWGMSVRFTGKAEYARRYDEDYLQELQSEYPDALIIPEGGAGGLGIEGSRLMAKVVARSIREPSVITLAMGTGTSFIGLLTANALPVDSIVYGYSALKNANILREKTLVELQSCPYPVPGWSISDDYCFGGFAKMDTELAFFMRQFESEQDIALDPVYTAKLFFAVNQQIEQGYIVAGSKIISVHTGGLQGRRGMPNIIDAYCCVAQQEIYRV